MNESQQSLETLKDIKSMMERSSRFISLSGLSGMAAGLCALAGAWFANRVINQSIIEHDSLRKHYEVVADQPITIRNYMGNPLLYIAVVTFVAALLLAFFFTWLRSKKTGTPLFGSVSRKLTISMMIPMAAGALYILKLMQAGSFGLIAPGCLLFYGLALVNASRYTLSEIKWLGYAEIITGIVCLSFTGKGLYFWAFGFGILHIAYGIIMWYRYERD